MTNCGEAKPKWSNAPKYLVIFKQQTVDKGNQSATMQKKSSPFQTTNCGQAKPKCSNAPKNLVIFK